MCVHVCACVRACVRVFMIGANAISFKAEIGLDGLQLSNLVMAQQTEANCYKKVTFFYFFCFLFILLLAHSDQLQYAGG